MDNCLVGSRPPRVETKVVYSYGWGDAGVFVPDNIYPYIVTRLDIAIEPDVNATGLVLDSTAWGYNATQNGTRKRNGRSKCIRVYPSSDFYLHFKMDAMSRYMAIRQDAVSS
jgi:hypothetical protein